jgi:hypothetical protein
MVQPRQTRMTPTPISTCCSASQTNEWCTRTCFPLLAWTWDMDIIRPAAASQEAEKRSIVVRTICLLLVRTTCTV